jgi:hypothetical protein
VVIRLLESIMAFILVKVVKASSSEPSAKNCHMFAGRTRIVSLIRGSEIDVNIAGKSYFKND